MGPDPREFAHVAIPFPCAGPVGFIDAANLRSLCQTWNLLNVESEAAVTLRFCQIYNRQKIFHRDIAISCSTT